MYSNRVFSIYSEKPKAMVLSKEFYPYKKISTPTLKISLNSKKQKETKEKKEKEKEKENPFLFKYSDNYFNIPKFRYYDYNNNKNNNNNNNLLNKSVPIITFSDNNGNPNIHYIHVSNLRNTILNNDYFQTNNPNNNIPINNNFQYNMNNINYNNNIPFNNINNNNELSLDFSGFQITLNLHNFSNGIQTLINRGKNFFVFLFGTHGIDGKSWCSDCNIAEPLVNYCKRVIALKQQEKEIYFVNITVDKQYRIYYLMDPNIRLNLIPSLIYFEKGKEIKRIEEKELFSISNIFNFVKSGY